jgi:hypothetical protein
VVEVELDERRIGLGHLQHRQESLQRDPECSLARLERVEQFRICLKIDHRDVRRVGCANLQTRTAQMHATLIDEASYWLEQVLDVFH